jgi:surfactin synthase thioesterase subunit
LFRGWSERIPGATLIPVELAGRGNRFAERPHTDLHEVVAELVRLTPPTGELWAVAGHSLGALLAAAWAASAHAAGAGPELVVVSASAPPWIRSTAVELEDPDDAQLWDRVAALGGVAPGIRDNPAARRILGRALRADIAAAARYRPPGPEPVGCPVVAVMGAEDPLVPLYLAEQWAPIADGHSFDSRVLPGGHFFTNGLDDLLPVLAELVSNRLTPKRAGSREL